MEDLTEVAQEVKDKLQIRPAADIADVLAGTGIMKKTARKKKTV